MMNFCILGMLFIIITPYIACLMLQSISTYHLATVVYLAFIYVTIHSLEGVHSKLTRNAFFGVLFLQVDVVCELHEIGHLQP